MIQLAEAGNVDAGRKLIDLAACSLRDHWPLSSTLANWLSARLEAVLDVVVSSPARVGIELRVCFERGRPAQSAKDMLGAFQIEAMKEMAAWAVFHDIYPNSALMPNVEAQPKKTAAACKSVSEWLAEQGWKYRGKPYSEKTIEAWYYARRDGMIKETRRLQGILSWLNAPN